MALWPPVLLLLVDKTCTSVCSLCSWVLTSWLQEYDPAKHEPPSPDEEEAITEEERTQEQAKGHEPNSLGTNYYQEKYKHLLGGLECAKESAVKMEPNKKFGYGEQFVFEM